jgi:hypothetical protein
MLEMLITGITIAGMTISGMIISEIMIIIKDALSND